MKITLFFIGVLLWLSLPQHLKAQENNLPTKRYKGTDFFEFAVSARHGEQLKGVLKYYPEADNWVSTWALSWNHLHHFGRQGKINLGYGVRFNSAFYQNQAHLTAPHKLRKIDMDTLMLGRSQSNSLNVTINLQYNFTKKFEVGFNIDALGFSFGKKQTGQFTATGKTTVETAKPTPLNYLIAGNHDRGMLNSEFYGKYWLTQKWALRAGATLIFTEYTTSQKLALANDRFRNKSFQFMLGVTYAPFRH